MKWKPLTVALCCLMSLCLSAQTFSLKGTIQDSKTEEGIPFANLLLLTEKTGTAADADGHFQLSVGKWPARIRISAIGYLTDTVVVEQADALQITLQPVPADLPLVEVLAQKKLRQLSPEDRLPFAFAIWDDYLFTLSRKRTGSNAWIEVRSPDGILLFEQQLDLRRVMDIEVNCRNRLYLLANYRYINLGYTRAQIVPMETMKYTDYIGAYRDCQCSTEEAMYYENVAYQGLLKRYLRASLTNGALDNFRQVLYAEQLDNYMADLGLIMEGQSISNTGDVSRAENDYIRTRQTDADFLQRVFYKNPQDNFLFLAGGELILFNHDEQRIEYFDADGRSKQVIPAYYVQHKDWNGRVIQDIKTEAFYALLRDESGYLLALIDLSTGQIGEPVPLNILYYDEIAIYNSTAFVLGTPTAHAFSDVKRLYTKPLW
ncbi:carboxypeptidase-like regulatory domain-containing protein [Phaeodactylibacter sp.]|uniref:carboxypeptidase-like regulatory domain-containing protein n=1 Tax=Phaeodactylibacter sp. TaxID=1940289 RepID=UPI0025F037C7|nr:carboxypeptidase-like regulatory domain-containing protein [Phaeodactylibacter sp.]MCI4651333.1 carboxypeptidase-like regulatory domain-containing protein [Phaeodactylibacter sp.]MCI5094044.1 carboxypeptidase-like regulatory domain-containing protein [Phaeodactylibacter sp.]